MSEAFGEMKLSDGNSYELRQDNLALYTHLGRYALFDHVFLATEEKGGYYFWNGTEEYGIMKDCVEQNDCIQLLNLPEASEFDQDVYVRHAMQDVGDTVPDEWT